MPEQRRAGQLVMIYIIIPISCCHDYSSTHIMHMRMRLMKSNMACRLLRVHIHMTAAGPSFITVFVSFGLFYAGH